MYTITKEFKFEAAHRLVKDYKGKCAHVHGHSWRVFVTVESKELDRHGFVKDFGELKPIKQWIDSTLDHAMLVAYEDADMTSFLAAHDQRYYVLEGNPTSENIAKEIYGIARELGFNATAVRVDETCTSSCEYRSSPG